MHERRTGRRERAREAAHFDGVSGIGGAHRARPRDAAPQPASLLRPLAEYEALAGGAF
jgi:hypothetical protein